MSAEGSRSTRAAKAQAKKDRQTDETVITALMSSVDGRRWVWLRLAESMLFIADEQLDPGVLAWKAGMRNSGLRLLASVMRHAPAMYVRMAQENTSVKNLEEQVDETDDNDLE